MTKTLKFQSKFLNCLTETIQKLNLSDEITVIKYPIMEADGKFTSVVQAKDTFDPSKVNSNILVDTEEENEDISQKKDYLVSKASDMITQTLKDTDELQSILNQIKKINSDTNANNWDLNEEGNTAVLKNRNAQIFKQNENLCLSHDNKIEVFKSVNELHDWLNKHNYPLPKNIKLHEADENDLNFSKLPAKYKFLKSKNSPWLDILLKRSTNAGLGVGDAVPALSDEEEEKLQAKRSKPIAKMGRDEYKQAMSKLTKKDLENDIKKSEIPTLGKDLPPKGSKNNAFSMEEWLMKLKNNNSNVEFADDDDSEENVNEAVESWYLQYMDNNDLDLLYLNKNWQDGTLLTNNLTEAESFDSREEAMSALDYIYSIHDTEFPFKPIQADNMNECCGVGVGSLGSAVQYLGDKKESSLKEEEQLDETFYGFPGTPFEKTVYKKRYNRGKDYFNWVNHLNKEGKRNVDPNAAENYPQAREDIEQTIRADRSVKDWKDMFSKFTDDFDDKGIISPERKEEFINHVKALNAKYNINIDPMQAVVGVRPKEIGAKPVKIKDQNKQAKEDWYKNYWLPNVFPQIRNKAFAGYDMRQAEYEKELATPSVGNNENINKAFNYLVSYGDSGADFKDFTKETVKYKNKLSPEEYSGLVNAIVDAYNKDQIDLDDANIHLLKLSKKADIYDMDESVSVSFEKSLLNLFEGLEYFKEDETPADFAAAETPDMGASTQTSEMNDINNTPDLDTDMGGSSAPTGFGDLNINLDGDYGPDDGEEGMDMQPTPGPEYRIIDVLVNDEDESDIKVKVQNLDTDEIETKSLYEIDI